MSAAMVKEIKANKFQMHVVDRNMLRSSEISKSSQIHTVFDDVYYRRNYKFKKKKLRKNPASQLLKYLFKEYVELYKGLSVSNLIYYES